MKFKSKIILNNDSNINLMCIEKIIIFLMYYLLRLVIAKNVISNALCALQLK